jgi:hypothetical protein
VSLAELFFAREGLRRRARNLLRARTRRRRVPALLEALEPRILLSADVPLAGLLLDPVIATAAPMLADPMEFQLALNGPVASAAGPVGVDGLVTVTYSGLVLNRATNTFDTRATITNVSGQTLQAPMRLIVTAIESTGTVTLANATGVNAEGDPFVDVALPGGELGPGGTVTQLLKFANPSRVRFTFTSSVEAVLEPVDGEAPTVTAGLANDTGRDDADGLTFDPTVSGTVTDASPLTAFRAGLDDTPVGSFTDVLGSLGPGGAFTFDAAALEAMNGEPLAQGAHTLHLFATDTAGNTSTTLDVAFTLDTLAPAAPTLDLAAGSDTPPAGDQQTTLVIVDLVGQTEAGADVALLETGDATLADGTGAFGFDGIDLALGTNVLTARATDAAGNSAEASRTITRLEEPDGDETPPVIAAALANDTGASDADGNTADPAVAGTVTDASPIASFRAGLDDTAPGDFVDLLLALEPDGGFALDAAALDAIAGGALADGPHTLHLIATDDQGNGSAPFDVVFTLDTEAPATLTFDLAPASDTAPAGDRETTLASVTLAGVTEPGARVTLVETGAEVTAADDGSFAFGGVSLALGDNAFTARAVDLAGNAAEAALTVTRLAGATPELTPPVVVAALVNDTGGSSTDRVTSDATIAGTVTDLASGIAALRSGFDAAAPASFVDVLFAVGPDGSFALDATALDLIAGGALADGPHTLHLLAVDGQGNQSEIVDVEFVLDRVAPGLTVAAPVPGTIQIGAHVVGSVDDLEAVAEYRLNDLAPHSLVLGPGGAFDQTLILAGIANGPAELTVIATDVAGNTTAVGFGVTAVGMPFFLAEQTPGDEAGGVAVGVRPKIVFSEPVDASTLTGATFFASAGGEVLPGTIVVDPSGLFARLFFDAPMPGGAEITVTVDGSAIRSAVGGAALDADGDGVAGGLGQSTFTSESVVALPGTTLSGQLADAGPDLVPRTADDSAPGPDGKLGTEDDVALIPLVGARIYFRGLEDAFVVTGADGRFHFDAVPGGPVTLALDGEFAAAPPGFTYLELTANIELIPAADNALGTVYTPRLAAAAVQTVNTAGTTVLTLPPGAAPGLTEEQRQLFTLEIGPGGLLGADGQPVSSAQVLMSVVSPDTLKPFLPETLPTPILSFTTQLRGAADVGTPFRMTFPNLSGATVGTRFRVLSFDPATGELIGDGVAVAVSSQALAAAAAGDAVAAADDIELVGDMIIWDPGNDGLGVVACFHIVLPDGPSLDSSECDPVVAPKQFVMPQFEDNDTLHDYLFTTDAGGFTLHFENTASPINPALDPCAPPNQEASPLIITLKVEGAPDQFLKGLDEGTWALHPGTRLDLDVDVRDLLIPEILNNAEGNKLFGAKVLVSGTVIDPETGLEIVVVDEELYVYRFLDAADGDGSDGVLTLERTFMDGTGGVDRVKDFIFDMPPTAVPIMSAGGEGFGFDGGAPKGLVRFDPPSGDEPRTFSGALNVITPNGPVGAGIELNARGVTAQRVLFSKAALVASVAELLDHSGDIGGLDAFFALFPADSGDPGALRSDEPGFATVVDGLYQQAVEVMNTTASTAALGSAFQVVDSAQGAGIPIAWNNESIGGPRTGPTALARSTWLDMALNRIETIMDEEDTTSLAQEQFRFAESFNLFQSDPGLDKGPGLVADLERIMIRAVGHGGQGSITPFATMLGNVLTHESGHLLGAFHPADTVGGPYATIVMSDAVPAFISEVRPWGPLFEPVVMAGIGLPVGVQPHLLAYHHYKTHLDFLIHSDGTFTGVGDGLTLDTPLLSVFDGPFAAGQPDPSYVGERVDFGALVADGAGGQSGDAPIFLFNAGDQPLTIGAIGLDGGAAGFSVVGASGPLVLAPGTGQLLTLRFEPAAAGPASDTLRIESDTFGGEPVLIALEGRGVSPAGDLVVDVPNNNLGGLRLGDPARTVLDAVTLTNAGASALTVSSITVTGGQGQLGVAGLPAGPLVLAPGESFSFDLTFDASFVGLQRARLEITSDDPDAPVRSVGVVGTGLTDTGTALDYGKDYVAVETPFVEGAPVQRTVSDAGGHWSFFVPASTRVDTTIFDPVSGLVSRTPGVSADTGDTESLLPLFVASTAPDSDGDGLPDDIELAVGSAADAVDTDADGIDDFTEIAAGASPLDGLTGPVGIVGALDLPGEAWDIATSDQIGYVATGDHGLAVVDLSDPEQPILLGAVNLAGFSRSVDVDGLRGLAAVASDNTVDAALRIVDVSDPAHPAQVHSLTLADGALHVAVLDGVAYVASGTSLVSVDMLSGQVLDTLDLGGGPLTGLARDGRTLFTMDTANTLRAIDIAGDGALAARDALALAQGGGDVFAGGGVAYVANSSGFRGGFATVDVSNPDSLVLISLSDVASGFRPEQAVGADGSDQVIVVGDVPDPSNPVTSIAVLDVANAADPANTDAYGARVLLPEFPLGVTLGAGVALVADGSADLLVVRYQSIDGAETPPAVTISATAEDVDPVTPGVQVVEGSLIQVQIAASDDVLVAGVDVLVNGAVVDTDVSFPHEALVVAGAPGPLAIQALATDIGGNAAHSNTLAFTVVADTFAPEIVSVDPPDGASEPEGLQQVQVRFSEALDPATVTAATFEVVTGGQVQTPLGVDLLAEGRLVQLRYAGLTAGGYQIVIDGGAVTDVAGNELAAGDVVSSFTLTGDAIQWINPGGGFWDDPANWEGGVLPGPNDNVLIDVAAEVTIVHRTGTTTINRLISRENLLLTGGRLDVTTTMQVDGILDIGSGATLANATLRPGAGAQPTVISFATFDAVTLATDVGIASLATLQVQNGLTLDGARLILQNSDVFFDGAQTLGGGGEVVFSGLDGADNRLAASSGLLTIGENVTIHGDQNGVLDAGTDGIRVEGTVEADTKDHVISIRGLWTNAGRLIGHGGTLELDGEFAFEGRGIFDATQGTVVLVGALDNTDKTLALDAVTGSLTADGGRIIGGTLTFADGATLAVEPTVTLEGVTLASNLTIEGLREVTAVGGLTLDDVTIELVDSTDAFFGPRLTFQGTQTLSGTGQVVFSGAGDDGDLFVTSGTTLTIGPNITVTGTAPGAGIGSTLGHIINQGVIAFETAGQFIDVLGSGLTNQGTMRVLNGARFTVQSLANSGTLTIGTGSQIVSTPGTVTFVQTAGGLIDLRGGTLNAGTLDVQGGVVAGFGTIDANVTNSGRIAPGVATGDQTGTISIVGNFAQSATGVLAIQLGGTAIADYDRLLVTLAGAPLGTATLGGTLEVTVLAGFTPALGNTFDVIAFEATAGAFATTTGLDLGGGRALQPSVLATAFRLTVV